MTLDTILEGILGAFQSYAEFARVILLHPKSRYRTALVSRLLAEGQVPVYYYAMAPDDVDVRTFVAGFTHDVAEQVPTFGAAINAVQLDNLSDMVPLLEAFSHDLNQLSSDPYLLLLDEFDRAQIGDDLETFFEALIDYLPPQCRLMVSSRDLPRFPWMSLIAQGKAIMLQDDTLINENFYRNESDADAR